MIGFPSILVGILRDSNMEISVRQSAVIYLKNLVNRAWKVDEADREKITQISEQDKIILRSHIVSWIVDAPEPIRFEWI